MSRFDRLYKENFRFVWAAALRCGTPASCLEDVVQDVFATAYRRLDELSWEVSARGWLYGVTRRVAFRYRRTAARVARRRATLAAAGHRVARPHDRADATLALDGLLDRLHRTQRDVFEMAELLGMSSPEIAAELGVPLNTVYSRLRLARARLLKLAGSPHALDRQLGSTKAAQQPDAGQARRTRAALAAVLGSATAKLGPGIAAAFKLATAPVLALVVVGIGYTNRPRTETHNELATAEAPESANQVMPAETSKTALSPRELPPPAQRSSPAPLVQSASTRWADGKLQPGPGRPSRTTHGRDLKPDSATSATPADRPPGDASDLALEIALIDVAKDLARRGAHEDALAKLREHAVLFPRGQLVDARLATRMAVQCTSGRSAAAETTARELHNRFPRSSVSRNTPKKCVAP